MSYAQRFEIADTVVAHLRTVTAAVSDPVLVSRHTGMVAVVAVSAYELAIKEIFKDFARRRDRAFGTFVDAVYSRLNGEIGLDRLREKHTQRFGGRYRQRFTRLLEAAELRALSKACFSPKSAYGNIISWRNRFVHEGEMPTTATFDEAARAFEHGKLVIHCLARAFRIRARSAPGDEPC